MPLQWKVSHLDRMVICVSEGVVTLEDFRGYLAALREEKALSFPKIFVATHGQSGLADGKTQKLAALLTSFLEIDGLGPFAVVAGSQRNDGLAAVFQSLAAVKRPMRVFPDIHAARKWLDGRSAY